MIEDDGHVPALFRRFPVLAGRIPWVPLGSFPTPVERLTLESGRELWVKRDDLSGERYGGNKVRKLEFLLGAAGAASAERLITAGAIGSHHALATAVYGGLRGFDTTLVLFPQPVTDHVRNVLRQHCVHATELRFTRRMELVPLAVLRARAAHRRSRVRVIPPGGSDADGTLGYVSGALELADQVRGGELPEPDVVHVAAGTLGTLVGLATGFDLAGLKTRLVGTRIASRIVCNRWALRSLARSASRRLESVGGPAPVPSTVVSRIELRHDRIGRGYGHATVEGRAAAARLEGAGLGTDPTYTAKAAVDALAGLDGDADRVRLLWHTLSATLPPGFAAKLTVDQVPAPFRRFLDPSRTVGAPVAAEPSTPDGSVTR